VAGGVEAAAPDPPVDLVMSPDNPVRAAGGLVVREGKGGRREVLLVHRPKYDDWSFPKGKADPGEKDEDTALREVEEETGLRCRLGAEVGTARYRDSQGRPKVVRYWFMEIESNREFVANREVDALRWCAIGDAAEVLSYPHDRKLLGGLGDGART
jgi:8-oxo-dGTP pyrophosphatase MutT (NUDIX family)